MIKIFSPSEYLYIGGGVGAVIRDPSLPLKILLKEAKYDNSTESGSLQIVFTLPDSPLSSLLMVPRAQGDAKRRKAEMIYTEKIKEALLAGR
jgi:hypothetical protein